MVYLRLQDADKTVILSWFIVSSSPSLKSELTSCPMTFHPHSPCLGWLMLLHVRGLLMCLLTDTLSSGPMHLLPFLAHHTFLLNSGTFHMLFHLEPSSPHHHSVRLLPRLLPCFKSSLSLQTRMNSFAIGSLLSL